ALEPCRLILISAPGEKIPRLVRELAASGIHWKGKAVVLCDSGFESPDLAALAARGAAAGTMDAIEALEQPAFILEGHPEALRELRRFLAPSRARTIEIKRGKKSL